MMTQTSTRRLQPGDAAPDFALWDADGEEVKLSSYRGHALVLYFYPAAGTPGCTTEAGDFRDSLSWLADLDHTVIGVSHDDPEALRRFRDEQGLGFRLLSDPTLDVHYVYGACTERGGSGDGVIRSTFLIDVAGRITRAMYDVRAEGHVADVRAIVGAAGDS
jgi:peroxiredoxin Q/BCP